MVLVSNYLLFSEKKRDDPMDLLLRMWFIFLNAYPTNMYSSESNKIHFFFPTYVIEPLYSLSNK
jgi:hypothetical protein